MRELIELISNNGIAVVCVGYLIYFQSTTMKSISETLASLSTNISIMNERLTGIENKVGEYHEG